MNRMDIVACTDNWFVMPSEEQYEKKSNAEGSLK